MSVEIGSLIDGKYKIVRLIGQGGMGAVYEAHHQIIDRRLAIKVLLPTAEEATAVARFEQEARAAGRIGNDHILEIFDFGSLPGGAHYMVMEFLDGEPLASRIESRIRLDGPETVRVAVQLLEGLGAAHRAGVLHRDLKPDNVFLVREKAGHRDFVKIIDFGISKFQAMDQEMRMTVTGMVVGTPYYVSPEQAQGLSTIDHRSDLYTVGVILYECLSGQVPFTADNFNNLLFKVVLEDPPALLSLVPDLDPDLAALVHRAMARKADDRFQSCEDFAQALIAWAEKAGAPLNVYGTRPSLLSIAPGTASLPPSATPGAAHSVTPRGTMVAQSVETPGAFGASQTVATVVSAKRRAPLYAGLAAGLVALGALGAFALSAGDDGAGADDKTELASGDSTAANATSRPAPEVETPHQPTVTAATAAAAVTQPTPPTPAAPSASAASAASAATSAAQAPTAQAAPPPRRSAPVAPRRSAPEAAAPTPTPAPTTTSNSGSSNRRYNFGY